MYVSRTIAAVTLSLALAACGGGGDSGGGVTPPGPSVFTSLNILPGDIIVPVGSTQQLTVMPLDQNGGTVTGATLSYVASSPSIATVSSSGLVTAVAQGSTSVTITGTKGGVTVTASAPVTISPPPTNFASVTGGDNLKFSPTRVDILAGGAVEFDFQATQHNVTFNSVAGAPADINSTAPNSKVDRIFTTAGSFNVTCTLHAGMNGVVVVH